MSAYTQVTGHQPDLQKMMKGDPVKEAQLLLDKHCYGPEPDGFFGDITERCLNQFKGAYGLPEDGLVDQTTWAALNDPPKMVARLHGTPSIVNNELHWSANNAGCPTIPAWTNISQCWAYERTNITNMTQAVDFATTSDQPIGTQEPFVIDLRTLLPSDAEYTAVITVGPDTATIDYQIFNGQVY